MTPVAAGPGVRGRPPERTFGSYPAEDVTFLLKDISGLLPETGTDDREAAIQGGRHYSEMLPVEYHPTAEYEALFHATLEASASRVACLTGVLAERIVAARGRDLVIVSMARAGTPVGVLVRRYLSRHLGVDAPHYSLSIIRGRGIDTNAVRHVVDAHPGSDVVFLDGWTGKGAIARELHRACAGQIAAYGLSPDLAVLADPGHCSPLFGTRDDVLVPSACLNATVSGLVSRTVLNAELIGPDDFHGAKYYAELADRDVSNLFVDRVSERFATVTAEAGAAAAMPVDPTLTWAGARAVEEIGRRFGIEDTNLVKPGVGEATRVLLRRRPWMMLVHPDHRADLGHLLLLADERGVKVVDYPEMSYAACGLIQPLSGSASQGLPG